MQHFVRVMQSYIAHQVIFVTWNEFKASLKTDLNNLDDLIKIHDDYLNRAIFRSEGFSVSNVQFIAFLSPKIFFKV